MTRLKLFGTDGIRGLANSETMNTEIAVALGRAAAYFVRNSDEVPRIVIGKDTRLSGYMIETAIVSGIVSMGLDAVTTGPLPTPGVGFICSTMRSRLGIMISASHNPSEQNGIKLFGQDGFKLDVEQEATIENLMLSHITEKHMAAARSVGKILQIQDSGGRYIQFLKSSFLRGINLHGFNIEIDCANGAGYKVAPALFTELGANVTAYNVRPNGHNINEECGALHPDMICSITGRSKTDIGIALDGDADRVLLADENGNLIDGDAILYICAKHLHEREHLGHATVVGTVMTNYGLDIALKREGISIVRTDVGDHNVTAYMRAHGMNLGGETCGHIIFLHHSNSGDGLLAALRVLSIMRQENKPLSALVKGYKPYPQKTINVSVREKRPLSDVEGIAIVRAAIDNKLEGRGRTVLRYSGTELLARVTVESDDEKLTEQYASELADAVRKHLGE